MGVLFAPRKGGTGAPLHMHLGVAERVPYSPEMEHLGLGAERDPNVSIHGGEGASDEHTLLLKVLDHFRCRVMRIHHEKVGV